MPRKETSLTNLLFQRNFCKNLNVSCTKLGIESGADPEILKKGGALYWPSWMTDEGNFRFQMSKKAKTTSETISFGKTFLSAFSKFLHFYIQLKFANEILSVFQNL